MKKRKPSILIAKSAGFCFGVRRAINIAERTAKTNSDVYTLGPLIHNPQEIKRLSGRGIKPLKSLAKLKGRTLILRTHGIPSELGRKLEAEKVDIVDATCPFVKRAQDTVKRLSKSDCQIVIFGDKTHPEVIGLVSYGKNKCVVAGSRDDIKGLDPSKKICVVSQTTQIPAGFRKLINGLKKIQPGVSVFDTICHATVERQKEAKAIARKADVALVVGGKNSSNTKRLYEICRKTVRTHLIETPEEIRPRWFSGAERIGVTAGASTPDWVIGKVVEKIKSIIYNSKALPKGRTGEKNGRR